MNRKEIRSKVQDIFRDIFDDEELVINDGTCAEDIEDWDSLEQINLIVSMEKTFNIKFDISEVEKLSNVGQMIDLIGSKIND